MMGLQLKTGINCKREHRVMKTVCGEMGIEVIKSAFRTSVDTLPLCASPKLTASFFLHSSHFSALGENVTGLAWCVVQIYVVIVHYIRLHQCHGKLLVNVLVSLSCSNEEQPIGFGSFTMRNSHFVPSGAKASIVKRLADLVIGKMFHFDLLMDVFLLLSSHSGARDFSSLPF